MIVKAVIIICVKSGLEICLIILIIITIPTINANMIIMIPLNFIKKSTIGLNFVIIFATTVEDGDDPPPPPPAPPPPPTAPRAVYNPPPALAAFCASAPNATIFVSKNANVKNIKFLTLFKFFFIFSPLIPFIFKFL